ncbi:MAG: hypothetical protein RLZZ347_67 [Candidatus Parcubacteria bacterium]|jgi:hypothetical protein
MLVTISVPDELFASVNELATRLGITGDECLIRMLRVGVHKIRCSDPSRQLSDEERKRVAELFGTKTWREIAQELGRKKKDIKECWMALVKKYVAENWKTASDSQIATRIKSNTNTVCVIRRSLGLVRPIDSKLKSRVGPPDPTSIKTIDPVEIRELLLNGGKTITDLITHYGLAVTRQRMKQICHEKDCWIDPVRRTAKWYATRYNNPDLASREKLCELRKVHKTFTGLSARLTVSVTILERIWALHGIPRPKDNCESRVQCTCSNPACGKQFTRYTNNKNRLGNLVLHPSCSHTCRNIVSRLFPPRLKGKPREKKV